MSKLCWYLCPLFPKSLIRFSHIFWSCLLLMLSYLRGFSLNDSLMLFLCHLLTTIYKLVITHCLSYFFFSFSYIFNFGAQCEYSEYAFVSSSSNSFFLPMIFYRHGLCCNCFGCCSESIEKAGEESMHQSQHLRHELEMVSKGRIHTYNFHV
jgi:hypothetical protein